MFDAVLLELGMPIMKCYSARKAKVVTAMHEGSNIQDCGQSISRVVTAPYQLTCQLLTHAGAKSVHELEAAAIHLFDRLVDAIRGVLPKPRSSNAIQRRRGPQ